LFSHAEIICSKNNTKNCGCVFKTSFHNRPADLETTNEVEILSYETVFPSKKKSVIDDEDYQILNKFCFMHLPLNREPLESLLRHFAFNLKLIVKQRIPFADSHKLE